MRSWDSCLFFFKLKKFNWKIIALQWCISFYCTAMWISYTYIPSLLSFPHSPPSHPSRSSQSIGLSSLRSTAASHMPVYAWQFCSLNSVILVIKRPFILQDDHTTAGQPGLTKMTQAHHREAHAKPILITASFAYFYHGGQKSYKLTLSNSSHQYWPMRRDRDSAVGRVIWEFWETFCFSDKRGKIRLMPSASLFFLATCRYATWGLQQPFCNQEEKAEPLSLILLSSWTVTYGYCDVLSRSVVAFFVTQQTVALQSPLSMEMSRQEYWSGLPFSSPFQYYFCLNPPCVVDNNHVCLLTARCNAMLY